ncbi:Uncharacterised protein [Mycobacteroides abscessus subsp. bolletii]|nr:Uncharacterised protein [Mycobacteroides abscessus subsp. bolletii]
MGLTVTVGAVIGDLGVVTYGEQGRTFPNQRANASS